MPKYNPFESGAQLYEEWFHDHEHIFQSELAAVRKCFLPQQKTIEIGLGTGIFAQPLGIKIGVEPSADMAKIARQKGIEVIAAYAEALPLEDNSYHQALMITVDCFLNDIHQAVAEIKRILCPEGNFIIAFINQASPLGQIYDQNKAKDPIYQWANFHTASQIQALLQDQAFAVLDTYQTITGFEDKPYPIRSGHGQGVFTVIKAKNLKT